MTTQYTTILKLALPVQGELSGTWGDVVNDNITEMVEQAIAGKATINSWTGNSHTLTTADGTTSESRCAILELTDSGTALTGAGTVVCPTNTKLYIVDNNTAEIVTVKTSGGTGVAVPVGKTMLVYCDGTNVVEGVTHANSLSLGTSTVTADKILDEDNMASDSATAIATQQSIKAYVDSQVGSFDTLAEVLAQGNTTGGTDLAVSTGDDITFADSSKAIFGAGSDLQIYHDGTNSYIDDAGTGELLIRGSAITRIQSYLGEDMIVAVTNGAANLYYDAAKKLATTATGIDVTGVITTDGMTTSADVSFGDNDKAIFGAGSDLQIYHNAGTSFITESGSGNFKIGGENLYLQNTAHNENYLAAIANQGVTLYYNNLAKIATTATGIDVTGTALAHEIEIGDGSAGGTSEILFSDNVSARGKILYDHSSNPETMLLQTTGTTAISIDNSQNISIPNGNLTVDGDVQINKTAPNLLLMESDTTDLNSAIYTTSGNLRVYTVNDAINAFTTRFNINHATGDVSLYEDTGTTPKLFWDASAEFLGIGADSPTQLLNLESATSPAILITDTTNTTSLLLRSQNNTSSVGTSSNHPLVFETNATEAMRIDSSGNLLVGTTSAGIGDAGIELRADGQITGTRDGSYVALLNRIGSGGTENGDIAEFRSNGTAVGSIGTKDSLPYFAGTSIGLRISGTQIRPSTSLGANNDNAVDLGKSDTRFKDLYLSGTLTNNGTGGISVDTSGNVGIGATTVNRKLEVAGNNNAGSRANFIRITDTDTSATAANPQGGIEFYTSDTGNENVTASIVNLYAGSGAGSELTFNTAPNGSAGVEERLRIDASGNVGIGEDNPSGLLHLRGDTNSNGAELFLQVNNNNTTDNLGAIHFGNNVDETLNTILGGTSGANNSSYLTFSTSNAGTLSEAMRIDASGNLLVGKTTSSPATAGHELLDYGRSIHTANATTVQIVNRLGNDGDISIFQKDGTTVGSIGSNSASGTPILDISSNSSSGIMRMRTSGTERMRIDASGNLLVGTTDTTPYNNNANSTADNGIVAGAGLFAAARYQGSVGLFNRTGNDGEILGFKRSGAAVGSISVTASATAYNTSSDQRLKENIADADDAGAKIDAIQVRKYDWKVDGSHQDYGMVAQELQVVAPEAVSAPEDPEEMMGVDYSKLVPMMLKEIQSLRARIAALES